MKKHDVAKKMNHDVAKGYDIARGSKRFQHLKQKGLESVLSKRSLNDDMLIDSKGNQRA